MILKYMMILNLKTKRFIFFHLNYILHAKNICVIENPRFIKAGALLTCDLEPGVILT